MHGWLPVGDDWRREPEGVPLAVLHGAAPGRVLYLQAVSDGDEMNGLAVLRRLLRRLDPALLHGAVVAVVVANPGAFRAGKAVDPRDGRKLNRCFPGLPDGSVSERVAWHLFHQVVARCDLVIDLHQNGEVPMVHEVRVRTGRRGPLHAECLALATAFGLPFILDQQGPAGQLARTAPAHGIPAIDPELGGNAGFGPAAIEAGVRGVYNVLYRYGLLEGEPEPPAQPYIAQRLVPLTAPIGGVVDFTVELGAHVREGQPVAHVTDVFGDHPMPVVSPVDGVLWIRSHDPAVVSGETVGAVGARDQAG